MDFDELLSKMNEAGETGYTRRTRPSVRVENFGGLKVGDIVTIKPGARWMGSNIADYPLRDDWEPKGTGDIKKLIDTGVPTAVVGFLGGEITVDSRSLTPVAEPEEEKPKIPSAMDQSSRGSRLG